jgi:hypothetical protein
MTPEEVVEKLQASYPELSYRELCVLLIQISGDQKVRQHIAGRKAYFARMNYIDAMVFQTRVRPVFFDKVSEYRAIAEVQEFATDRSSDYVKQLWKRYKEDHPERIDEIEAKMISDLKEYLEDKKS